MSLGVVGMFLRVMPTLMSLDGVREARCERLNIDDPAEAIGPRPSASRSWSCTRSAVPSAFHRDGC